MAEIVGKRLVEENFPGSTLHRARGSVHVTDGRVLHSQRKQSAIQASLDVSNLDVFLQSNGCSPSCVVHIEENDIAWQGKLFVFYFLQTHNIEVLAVDKGTERVDFRGVRNSADIYRSDVVRRESHLYVVVHFSIFVVVVRAWFFTSWSSSASPAASRGTEIVGFVTVAGFALRAQYNIWFFEYVFHGLR